jgi:hypothetical protein
MFNLIIRGDVEIKSVFDGSSGTMFTNLCNRIKIRELLLMKFLGGEVESAVIDNCVNVCPMFLILSRINSKFKKISRLFTDNYTLNLDEMFEKHNKISKNKGNIIPLQARKNSIRSFIGRIQDLDEFPKKISILFSGNSTRHYHKLFDDATEDYDQESTSINQIKSFIRSQLKGEKGEDKFLSLQQEQVIIEYHTYAFNIKLGVNVFPSSSRNMCITVNTKRVLKVRLHLFTAYCS